MTKSFDVYKMLAWKAFQRVKPKGGSPGVDQESKSSFCRVVPPRHLHLDAATSKRF